jgi:hypothetical protein
LLWKVVAHAVEATLRAGRPVSTVAARTTVGGRRVESVDACRAVAVVAMLVANLLNVCLREVPRPLTHNQGDVLRLFDFPAPIFQLLVGVSLALFLDARRRSGLTPAEAAVAALRRFGLLVVLGMVLDGVGRLTLAPCWGVLQTLGLGGAVATVLSPYPAAVRVGVAVALLGAFSGAANGVVHASPLASLAFVPLTLLGHVLGERIAAGAEPRQVARDALAAAGAAAALALVARAEGVPFNKVLGTASFVALAAAAGAGLLALAAAREAAGRAMPPWLLAVGRSALTAWVLLHALVYYPAWLLLPGWERLPLAPGMAAVAGGTAMLCGLAVSLGRGGVRVPL